MSARTSRLDTLLRVRRIEEETSRGRLAGRPARRARRARTARAGAPAVRRAPPVPSDTTRWSLAARALSRLPRRPASARCAGRDRARRRRRGWAGHPAERRGPRRVERDGDAPRRTRTARRAGRGGRPAGPARRRPAHRRGVGRQQLTDRSDGRGGTHDRRDLRARRRTGPHRRASRAGSPPLRPRPAVPSAPARRRTGGAPAAWHAAAHSTGAARRRVRGGPGPAERADARDAGDRAGPRRVLVVTDAPMAAGQFGPLPPSPATRWSPTPASTSASPTSGVAPTPRRAWTAPASCSGSTPTSASTCRG